MEKIIWTRQEHGWWTTEHNGKFAGIVKEHGMWYIYAGETKMFGMMLLREAKAAAEKILKNKA